jgi:hypothetical protein
MAFITSPNSPETMMILSLVPGKNSWHSSFYLTEKKYQNYC